MRIASACRWRLTCLDSSFWLVRAPWSLRLVPHFYERLGFRPAELRMFFWVDSTCFYFFKLFAEYGFLTVQHISFSLCLDRIICTVVDVDRVTFNNVSITAFSLPGVYITLKEIGEFYPSSGYMILFNCSDVEHTCNRFRISDIHWTYWGKDR